MLDSGTEGPGFTLQSQRCWVTVLGTLFTPRDVKTVYFSEPVTGLPKPVFTGYRKAYCERDNCHRSLRDCYQLIACCFTAAVTHIPDARMPSKRNKGQWHIKAVGGRGNRCFCRHDLTTTVTPLSRPGSAKTAASVCLYSVYRKPERSLFTAALEQTSNVPTAIVLPRPMAGLWSPIPGIRSAMASLRRAARLHF